MKPRAPRSCHLAKRTKVKSGCRTCKIRKVKCDEGYPACRRCVSTGRECEGYGIWGGGGNSHKSLQQVGSHVDLLLSCFCPLAFDSSERSNFDWFQNRSITKLPGSFTSDFWSSLLLQASITEPPVWHAVMSLSSLHRTGVIATTDIGNQDGAPSELEKFVLRHYVKAISLLKPRLSVSRQGDVQVALITCIVFVSLEFLRGSSAMAQLHLRSGLEILREIQSGSSQNINSPEGSFPYSQPIDHCITEMLVRLQSQVRVFNHLYGHTTTDPHPAATSPSVKLFWDFRIAWRELDFLFDDIFRLMKRESSLTRTTTSAAIPEMLSISKTQLQINLEQWRVTYDKSAATLKTGDTIKIQKAYRILGVHHTMAKIMANLCLEYDDESSYDLETENFLHLVTQLADLWAISFNPEEYNIPGQLLYISSSITDVGCIAPLFFVVMKCRVHRLRLQAVRMLESARHREGIWDATIAAHVARRIMQIEEQDFYCNVPTPDDFDLTSHPELKDLALLSLPDSYRITEVMVRFLGDPVERVLLAYKHSSASDRGTRHVCEYHTKLQRWML